MAHAAPGVRHFLVEGSLTLQAQVAEAVKTRTGRRYTARREEGMRKLPERQRCHRCGMIERSHGFVRAGYRLGGDYVLAAPGDVPTPGDSADALIAVTLCRPCADELRRASAIIEGEVSTIIEGDAGAR